MKRIKLFFAAATLCAAAAVGYYAYEQATMTEEERLMQANLEALSDIEYGQSGQFCYGGWTENVSGSQSREFLCATCTTIWKVKFINPSQCN